MKRSYAVYSIALVLIIILSGCSIGIEEQQNQTVIDLIHCWGTMSEEHQAMRKIYEQFEKENPDIRLNLISMPSEERVENKIREMLFIGKVPNLIYVNRMEHNAIFEFMKQNGYLLDLMPYINNDENLQSFIPEEYLATYSTAHDELYSVADIKQICGYWYNASMFENAGVSEIPETWEEFAEALRRLAKWIDSIKYTNEPIYLDKKTALYLLQAYLAGTNEKMQDYNVQFSEALKCIKDISKVTSFEEKDLTERDIIRNFNIGRTAIYIGNIYDEHLINENLIMRFAAFPSMQGKPVLLNSFCPGYMVGNSGDEKQKEACIRFIKYMLSSQVQEQIFLDADCIPIHDPDNMEELFQQAGKERFHETYHNVGNETISVRFPENSWPQQKITLFEDNIMNYLSGDLNESEFMNCMHIEARFW